MAHFNLTAATPSRSKFTFLIATSPSSSPSKPTYTFTANPTKAGTTADLENENFTLHLQHPPNQPLNLHILECSFFKTHVNPATSYRRLCARRDTRVFRHICLRWPAQTQTTSDTPASPYELDVLVPAPMEVSANAANGSRIEAKMHHADGATQEAPPRPTEATSTITGGEQVGDDGAEGVQQPIQIMHHMSTLPRQGTVFRPRLYTIYTYPTAAGDLPLVPLTAAVPARPEYWTGEEGLLRGVKAWDFDGRVLTEGEYALCTRTRTWTEEVGKRSRAVLRGMCVVMTGKPSVDPTGLTRVVRRICLTFPALAPRKPRSEPLHLEAFVLAPARLDAASPSHVKSGAVAREAPERTKRERGVVPCRAAAPTGKILHYPPLAGYGALKPRRYSVYTYPVDSRLSASVPDSAILPAKPGDWFGKSVRGWSCLNTVIPDWEIVDRTKSWLWSEDAGCVTS